MQCRIYSLSSSGKRERARETLNHTKDTTTTKFWFILYNSAEWNSFCGINAVTEWIIKCWSNDPCSLAHSLHPISIHLFVLTSFIKLRCPTTQRSPLLLILLLLFRFVCFALSNKIMHLIGSNYIMLHMFFPLNHTLEPIQWATYDNIFCFLFHF